jgi:hypothetical protein
MESAAPIFKVEEQAEGKTLVENFGQKQENRKPIDLSWRCPPFARS